MGAPRIRPPPATCGNFSLLMSVETLSHGKR
jgi:hypothetical protein